MAVETKVRQAAALQGGEFCGGGGVGDNAEVESGSIHISFDFHVELI
jgi:hypothetical protein